MIRVPSLGRLAWLGIALLLALIGFAAFAPLFLPDPAFQDYAAVLQGPSFSHPLGADHLGRDLLSRLAGGASVSLTVALVSQAVALGLGVTIGGLAVWAGGRADALLMRLTDAAFAFPAILLLILLRAVVRGDAWTLALALFSWPLFARLARGQFLALKQREFVLAAEAAGAGPVRVLWRHLLPNAEGPLLVAWAFALPQAIFLEASLGFLGLSVPPPAPSWGGMIHDGYAVVALRPAAVVAPVVAVVVLTFAATCLAEGLRTRSARRSGRSLIDLSAPSHRDQALAA